MFPRQAVAAGALVAVIGTLVLLGWTYDVAVVKSVLPGWRVMVPASAASFALIGVGLICAAQSSDRLSSIVAARAASVAALGLPLITLIEYLSGVRTGVESAFGIAFDRSSAVAGRMSPLSSVCFLAVAISVLAATISGRRARAISRITSGATLLTAWLAMLSVAFDNERLADVPRFPGMAVTTIALMAVVSWGTLMLSLWRDRSAFLMVVPQRRSGIFVTLAFVVPLILAWIRDLNQDRWPAQVMTSLFVFAFTGALAAIIWYYSSQIALLRQERERVMAELERRVDERTAELAARNEALHTSEDRLRDADRRKDEFLATLAHELRNPLAPIRNAAAVLRSEHVTDAEKAHARTIIDRQVAQMSRLIEDLLDVSRIGAGKMPIQRSPLSVADVLNLAIATARPHLDQARHRLVVSLPDETVMISADETRLAQVFANLLHNASKYTEPGGEIQLTASLPNDTEVMIAVRDNGIGIPPEFLPEVFDKFSQVAPALQRSQGGMGLGLSLVRGIITLHGGRVEARSAGLGRGSEFIVYLPVLQAGEQKSEAPPRMVFNGSHSARRVLVVDDNADSAESMALLLRLDGHVVEIACDGEEALLIADRFRPDAMLLDLGMPKLNGFDVCRSIRSRAWGASILIVAQTGWGQAQDRARTLEAGFDAHLTKPVDPETIKGMLDNLHVDRDVEA